MMPCYCWSNTVLTLGRPTEAMVIREACPACGSKRYKKNGHTRHGKQNHQCKACERQFGATAEDHLISEAQRTMIEHLLRERISLRGICRAVGVGSATQVMLVIRFRATVVQKQIRK